MTDTTDIVSLTDIKQHLNVTLDVDDMLLAGKLEAARSHLESYVGPLEDFEDDIPEALKEALRQLAGSFYEGREATFTGQGAVTEVPFGFYEMIAPWRKWEF